ncbi:MAG: ATP-binding cassette domain-containing protein, partial [Thermoanaerobaculia bacterium]
RRYGDLTAVDQISFEVNEGEIVGMLGPNGAGKTTAIRMITGFLPPTEGRVRVAGDDLFADPVRVRRQIGYLPEHVSLYPEMRVSEYLAYRATLEGLSRGKSRERLAEVVESCFLDEVRDQIIGTLSKGYRQRVGLASAILHQPKVLVLDEPTVGLDPKQIIAIRELIRELGRQQTLLLSTHILPEVELLCDRVIIIDRGKIIAQGTPESLRESWVGNTLLRVGLKGDPEGAAEVLGAVPGVLAVESQKGNAGHYRLECEQSSDPREAVFRIAVERGWVLLELTEERASLEEIFVRLTTRDPSAEAPEVQADAPVEEITT